MHEELLEEWNWQTAQPTGKAVSRNEAHKTGIAHEGVHLWIVSSINSTPHLLFQRRAMHKQFYPGYLDITVGGHVVYEQSEDKLGKEAFEELGIIPDYAALIDLGYFRYEETIPEFSLVHREFQHIWIMFDNRPLDSYKFTDGEVDGLAAVAIEQFKKVLSGKAEETGGFFYDGKATTQKTFTKSEFHPLFFTGPMSEYMKTLIKEIESRELNLK